MYDIIIIGAGASGLLAAYSAKLKSNKSSILVIEKMPRAGRKIMITGKGRCNICNLKNWEDFSPHIRTKQNFLRSAFYSLNPHKLVELLESKGLKTVVERGDRVYPESMRSSSVVDCLVEINKNLGVDFAYNQEVKELYKENGLFVIKGKSSSYSSRLLIIATGGLSYPSTGSTGDGYKFAELFGHKINKCFPSLTAIVPKNYKTGYSGSNIHIARNTPMSELGHKLNGLKLKNTELSLYANKELIQKEFGEVYFTDGGIEGPIGFKISRNAVKSMINGAKVSVELDIKTSVDEEELVIRIKEKWQEIPKTIKLQKAYSILLEKLIAREGIEAFKLLNPQILIGKQNNQRIDFKRLAHSLKHFYFDIDGYVSWERAVITAGGINTDEIVAKSMESKLESNLFFCGEVLDIDADTGGYNLQLAFSTGYLAGESAAKKMLSQ